MYRCALVVVAAVSICAPAVAQVARQFPQTALRGEMVVTAPPEVALNGKPARLSPGARIRAEDNMLRLSASLVGRKMVVHYTVDPNGQLADVWILRPDEIARQPWPVTPQQAATWGFDPIAQVWTEP